MKRWAWRIAQIVFAVLILVGVYRRLAPELRKMSWADLQRWHPSLTVLTISTALLVLVLVGHALLWRRIMIDVVSHRPSFASTLRIYFISSLGRYVPGKVWQIAGFALLSQREGLPPVEATAAALMGQLAFLSTGIVFAVALLPSWAGLTPLFLVVALIAALAVSVYFLARTHAGARLREKLGARLGERFTSALGVADRIKPSHAALWTVGYAFTWGLLGVAFALLALAFVPTAWPHFRQLAGTVAASYVAGYIAFFAPAGIGVREAVMSLLLSQVLPVSAALLIAVASRIWFTVAELLPLLVIPFLRDGRGAHAPAK